MERTCAAISRRYEHRTACLAAVAFALLLAVYSSFIGQAYWEAEFMQGLQWASPGATEWLAAALTQYGRSTPYMITAVAGAALLLWARHHMLAILLMAAMGLRALSPLMKDLIDRPRPSPELVDVAHRLSTSSFPSGHVFGATLLYGFLAYAAEYAIPNLRVRRAVQSVCIGMVALMGYARMEMGAHWPADVMGGWLIGMLFVSGLAWLHQRTAPGAAPVPVEIR